MGFILGTDLSCDLASTDCLKINSVNYKFNGEQVHRNFIPYLHYQFVIANMNVLDANLLIYSSSFHSSEHSSREVSSVAMKIHYLTFVITWRPLSNIT